MSESDSEQEIQPLVRREVVVSVQLPTAQAASPAAVSQQRSALVEWNRSQQILLQRNPLEPSTENEIDQRWSIVLKYAVIGTSMILGYQLTDGFSSPGDSNALIGFGLAHFLNFSIRSLLQENSINLTPRGVLGILQDQVSSSATGLAAGFYGTQTLRRGFHAISGILYPSSDVLIHGNSINNGS